MEELNCGLSKEKIASFSFSSFHNFKLLFPFFPWLMRVFLTPGISTFIQSFFISFIYLSILFFSRFHITNQGFFSVTGFFQAASVPPSFFFPSMTFSAVTYLLYIKYNHYIGMPMYCNSAKSTGIPLFTAKSDLKACNNEHTRSSTLFQAIYEVPFLHSPRSLVLSLLLHLEAFSAVDISVPDGCLS